MKVAARGWRCCGAGRSRVGGAMIRQCSHADLAREVFGNPFSGAKVEQAWLAWGDGIASRLARATDEDGNFDRLPIIADALEEAGCDDQAALYHLRSPGPHVRGC